MADPPASGDGWDELDIDVFGAFDLGQLAAAADPRSGAPPQVVQGWNGGAYGAWARGGETAVSVRVRFDDDAAAATVCNLIPRWYETVADGAPAGENLWQGDTDVLALHCEPGGVRLALAPDATTASGLLQE